MVYSLYVQSQWVSLLVDSDPSINHKHTKVCNIICTEFYYPPTPTRATIALPPHPISNDSDVEDKCTVYRYIDWLGHVRR